ncbi:MAG TPA: NYN domain-containing protein, partial [Streptosporangiaceae bacterium]
MDRCALFVDAGYVLTDGAMAVHGTRRRESVSWDYAGLLQLFGNLAMERTRLPLLRCYWYEATVEGRRSADHDTLADLPGVKLRVAKMRPGRREGVEGEIHRDLTTLARNKAVSDVMVVSAEEDLAPVIADVQDMGMRVTLLHIAAEGNGTIPRALRQECDDLMEISAAHLRPYVDLISGAEPPRPDESDGASLALRPAMNGSVNGNGVNGNGVNGNGVNGNGTASPSGRNVAYAQSLGRPGAEHRPPIPSGPPAPPAPPVPSAPAAADHPGRQAPQPAGMDAAHGDPGQPGQPEHADNGLDYATSVEYGAVADYARAADQAPSVDQASVDYGSALDYGPTADYGPAPDYAAPAPMPTPVSVPPREDIYAAPVALPTEDLPGDREFDRDRAAGRPRLGGDLAAYNPGAVREPYQRDGLLREAADQGDRLQPVPVVLPGNGSAQVRRLPTRGPLPGGPNQGQPPLGLPPVPTEAGLGQQPGGQLPGGLSSGQPTGGQPVAPVAPVVPMDYPGSRGAPLGGPRHVIQGPGGPGPQVPPGSQPGPQVPQAPPVPQAPGGQQVPGPPPELGGPSGPI